MVVPTQLAFLPVLQGFSGIASWATSLNAWMTDCEVTRSCQVASKSFASLWVTHTAFGLPLAIYLLRNYIVGLPKELLESARVDGASHLQIFTRCQYRHWLLLVFSSSCGSGMISSSHYILVLQIPQTWFFLSVCKNNSVRLKINCIC